MFLCSDGTFLSSASRCNMNHECASGDDEQGCSSIVYQYNFSCKNGILISIRKVCDYIDNCGDSSDEDNVICNHQMCANNVICRNLQCVSHNLVNDSFVNCHYKSDENVTFLPNMGHSSINANLHKLCIYETDTYHNIVTIMLPC